MTEGAGGPIFTPDDEPYLGLSEVLAFDRLIVIAMREQVTIATWTHGHEPSRLQLAASQIVPSACSIALSIRELVRQAYLLSAMILLRPLAERIGALTYIIEDPSGLDLWEAGWPYARRPKFPQLLAFMSRTREASATVQGVDASEQRAAFDEHAAIASYYNDLVHGSPETAMETFVTLPDGRQAFTSGKDPWSPERAANIAAQAAVYLLVLTGQTIVQVFPEVPHDHSDGRGPRTH
jgi:hypothetical protein